MITKQKEKSKTKGNAVHLTTCQ